MKIISKFKDYYDHEVGYYGYDETRVYDRRGKIVTPANLYGNHYMFGICGKLVPVINTSVGFVFTEKDIPKDQKYLHEAKNFIWQSGRLTDVNQKTGQPVLFLSNYGEFWHDENQNSTITIPKLSEFGFPSRFSSREMYSRIYDYLGWLKDNPPIPDKMTNKEKIVSHGFDQKTSFRPKMKA